MGKMIRVPSATESIWINPKFITMVRVDSIGSKDTYYFSVFGEEDVVMSIDRKHPDASEEAVLKQLRQLGVVEC